VNKRSAFVARIEWLVDFGASVAALIVYAGTLAPTITWAHSGADSGDLITAAWTLGVPHPTGYPLYTILAGLVSHLPLGDPARNINLLSAICAGVTVLLLARAVRGITQDNGEPTVVNHFTAPLLALVFAFAPLFWSQAIIAEVYTLHMLFTVALYTVLFSFTSHRFVLIALILGLGLAHHLTIILFVPGGLVLIDQRPSRKQIVHAAMAFIFPLTVYFYLPIRAMAEPPINWGGVITLERFGWMVSGAAYRPYLLTPSLADVFARLGSTLRLLFEQFGVWGVALGLWGFVQMGMMPTATSRRRLTALLISLSVILVFALVYGSRDSFVYLLPAMAIFILGMGYGVDDLTRRLPMRSVSVALTVALVFFSAYNLTTNWQAMNLSNDRAAVDYAEKIFQAIPKDAVVLTDGDEHLFALWYYCYVVAPSSQVSIVSAELLQYDWYVEQTHRRLPWTSFANPAQNNTFVQRLDQVIETSLATGHSVYSTGKTAWLASYTLEEREGLYWIRNGRR